MQVKRRACPALVGRKEAAKLLGVKPENLFRDIPEMPDPLQSRGIVGFEVTTGPLWPRAEITELVKLRKAAKVAAVREAKRAAKAASGR